MQETTIGQLLISSTLPSDIKLPDEITKKTINSFYGELARKYPDRYGEITKKLNQIAVQALYSNDCASFSLDDLRPLPSSYSYRPVILKEIEQIASSKLPDREKRKKIADAILRHSQNLLQLTQDEAKAANNRFYEYVYSGARGNPAQLKRLITGDTAYFDPSGEVVPFPVLSAYSAGVPPAEFWAACYGARKGLADTKLDVARSGYLAKLLNRATHRLVVIGHDAKTKTPYPIGLPVETQDPDNIGAFLALPAGRWPAGTEITPAVYEDLKRDGIKKIVVRSPIASPAVDGIYAVDAGIREHGRLPEIGSIPGMVAAQAIGERLAQTSLSSKHLGGVVKFSGFRVLEQMLNVPKFYVGGAIHSQVDGKVRSIDKNEIGQWRIVIGEQEHLAPPSHKPIVKEGDVVEAGDILTEGLPNPAEVVKHKGVGEGRRAFVKMFYEAMRDAGQPVHRRNVELLARGLIDHVIITQPFGGFYLDEIVPYGEVAKRWTPRKGSVRVPVDSALGYYLEVPVLHYTIGTKIKPSVIKELKEAGIKDIIVHSDPPPFESYMVRAASSLEFDPNWMTRLFGSNQIRALLSAVRQGATGEIYGTSFVPAKAIGIPLGQWIRGVVNR